MQIEIELLKACTENDRKAQKELYKCCFRIFMPQCLRYNLNEEDARFAFNNAFLKILSGLETSKLKELILVPSGHLQKRFLKGVFILAFLFSAL